MGGMVPECKTLQQLKDNLAIDEPKNLGNFLSRFSMIIPPIEGKLDVIERVAREFVEDCARNGIAYCEARYSPTLLLKDGMLKGDQVVEAVSRGLRLGEADHPGVKVRQILCVISGHSAEDNYKVLQLCLKHRGGDVVGMDMAGDENCADFGSKEVELFEEAVKSGVHRTVHAGEDGPADNVRKALDKLHAERIGHGYHVLDDPQLYQRCLSEKVHFETCPLSSVLTGAASAALATTNSHPVLTFAKDEGNFSISTDDPTVTGIRLQDELELVKSWGLSDTHVVRAQFNAARASFLPPDEKDQLIKQLQIAYGVI